MKGKSVIKNLRILAKSNRYQTIYSQCDKGLRLFKNDTDLSELQIKFLNYLSFYSSLFMDLVMGDIDDRVFNDFIYEDAYNYWKYHSKEKNKKGETSTPADINWVFKSKENGTRHINLSN